jgi:hypothetical protein
MWG